MNILTIYFVMNYFEEFDSWAEETEIQEKLIMENHIPHYHNPLFHKAYKNKKKKARVTFYHEKNREDNLKVNPTGLPRMRQTLR